MTRNYKCLDVNEFRDGDYQLIPIRDFDKHAIREWRNQQIEILRQSEPLSAEMQDSYFKNIVDQLFEVENPKQLLWSFLYKNELIGYGGLVHIDWEKRQAEISFLTQTDRNHDKEIFISDWTNYLKIVKRIAGDYLDFNRIFTYAYDIRPNLYISLENSGFKETQRIKNEILINHQKKDVVIHSLFLPKLNMRNAKKDDADIYFNWANDEQVRLNSFSIEKIEYDQHINWFNKKLNDDNCFFYFFTDEKNKPVGQVRIDKSNDENIIGISVDEAFRKSKLSAKMLVMACRNYLNQFKNNNITAYIKEENKASFKTFLNADFQLVEKTIINGCKSFKLIKFRHE